MNLETRHCVLCGPTAKKVVKYAANFCDDDLNRAVFSARRAPDRRHFRLVQCEQCSMVFSDPVCSVTRLSQLYSDATVTYQSEEAQIYESYRPILDRALALGSNRNAFLEIGGGRGFMLRYGVENHFAQQIEIEPSEDACRRFEKVSDHARFICQVFTQGALPPETVSFACFFQMLDHVPDPVRFLQEVFEVLEPGGVVACVTHNTEAWSAKLLGERSPIYDIEHTYLFNPSNLGSLVRKVGFEAVDTFRVSNKYSARHWFNLTPLPKRVKPTLALWLEKTGAARIPIPLFAGNFGVVARKPHKD